MQICVFEVNNFREQSTPSWQDGLNSNKKNYFSKEAMWENDLMDVGYDLSFQN